MNGTSYDPKAFIDYVKSKRENGMTEAQIARSLSLKTSEYRRILHESRTALRQKG